MKSRCAICAILIFSKYVSPQLLCDNKIYLSQPTHKAGEYRMLDEQCNGRPTWFNAIKDAFVFWTGSRWKAGRPNCNPTENFFVEWFIHGKYMCCST